MTTTIIDSRLLLDEADATTGWSSGTSVYTSNPTPIESTGCLGMQVSNETSNVYKNITSRNMSGGGSLSVWMRPFGAMDTQANGGCMILVSDGTNRIGYHVGGSDKTAFRHDTGPIEWSCFILDPANKPANFTTFAGSESSLNEAAITQIGVGFKTLQKSLGGVENCFFDIIRWADPGVGASVIGGSTSGTAGNMAEVAALDRSVGNQQAHGVVRELATGVYGIQGCLKIGNPANTNDQYFEDNNVTYAWEDRDLSDANYYKFEVYGGTGTCSIIITDSSFTVPENAAAIFNGLHTGLDVCTIKRNVFLHLHAGTENGVVTAGAGDDWTFNTYIHCGPIVASGADMSNSVINGSDAAAALNWSLSTDMDGILDNIQFTSDGTGHALEITPVGAGPFSYTLQGHSYSGYASTDGSTGNECILIDPATADADITLTIGSGSTPTIMEAAGYTGTFTLIAGTVTVEVVVLDESTGLPIQYAHVWIGKASDGTELHAAATDVNGKTSFQYTYSTDLPIIGWARQMDLIGTDYVPKNFTGTILSTGFTTTLSLTPLT